MAYQRKGTGRAMSMPAGIGIGIGVSLVITMLGAMILAWLVVTERVGQSGIGYGIMVIQTISAVFACMVSKICVKHRALMVSGITCVGYYLVLVTIGLAFGGLHEGMIVTAVMILLGGGIAQIPGLIRGGSGARRHKITPYR